MPSAVAEVLDLCENARRVSGGWFDPWAMPAGVDPTGLFKGWAVEQALAVLHEAGTGGASCPHFLSAWAGLGVMCLYTVIALAAGGWLLARRDA